MLKRNKFIRLIACAAVTASLFTVMPTGVMAGEYSCFMDYDDGQGGEGLKTGTDSQGIEWKYYVAADGTASIWGTFYPKENMVIPSEIDGHKVTKIANLVEETSRSQSDYGVRSKTPKSVEIPEGVTEIAAYSLNYENLNNIMIPSTVKSIGAHAFNQAWDNAHKDSNGYVVYNGILLSADNAQGEVKIPDGIKCIGDYAFYCNDNITSVTIHSNVKKIGKYSFFRCKNLKTASIEEGVEVIGRGAFEDCYELRNAKVPSTVKELGVQAFEPSSATEDTNSGTSEGLVISDGVLMSGKDAKGDVVIPDGVTKIAERAFYNNQNITSVKIPNTVTEMGWIAFAGSSIKSVTIPGSIKTIPNTAFEHCVNLESVEIGDGVQTIDSTAFSQCGKIKEINLPSSVTKIGSGAFRGCEGLETFNYGDNIVVSDGAFLGTKFDGVIVSRGTVSEGSTGTAGDGNGNTTGEGSGNTSGGSQTGGTGSAEGEDDVYSPGFSIGWHKESDGKWYFYDYEDGHKSTGWVFDRLEHQSWFYFNQDGTIYTGWLNDNGTWYYLNENGTMKTGWLYDGAWYYLNGNGSMHTGWLNDNGTWYYLNGNGTMRTGWFLDSDGKWYYLYGNGAMAKNAWVGGYYLSSSGAWAW